jgi:hypothetical protein
MKINLFFSKLIFFFVLLMSACATGVPTEKIDYTYAFCDGNSKVWMLQKVRNGEAVVEEYLDLGGEFLIFYSSGKVVKGKLNDLSSKKGTIGSYSLDNENGFVTIKFPNERWDFSFEFSYENRLVLYPTTDSDFIQTIELVPFPEL